MAGNHNHADDFDMRQSEETWNNFCKLAFGTVVLCIVIVVGLALFVA
jgi:hypothetical protein